MPVSSLDTTGTRYASAIIGTTVYPVVSVSVVLPVLLPGIRRHYGGGNAVLYWFLCGSSYRCH